MAGDDVFRAGLGILNSQGLHPAHVLPDNALLSFVAGNGHQVVIAAGGVGAASQTVSSYSDSIFAVRAGHLVILADSSLDLHGPTVSSDGTVAAIKPHDGYWTRTPGSHKWAHDPHMSHGDLSWISWDASGDAFTVLGGNRPEAVVVEFPVSGQIRRLGSVPCASGVLHAPIGLSMVTTLPPKEALQSKCDTAYMIDAKGVTPLPPAWNPIAWAPNAKHLLLTSAHQVGAWSVAKRTFVAEASLPTDLWMGTAFGALRS